MLAFFSLSTTYAQVGAWQSFSTKVVCTFSRILNIASPRCITLPANNVVDNTNNSNTNNTDLTSQITSLQNQINSIKSNNSSITYTNTNGDKVVYVKGEKGDTGPQGPKGDTAYINSNSNTNSTTNWSSVWIPEPKYQYVPVASGSSNTIFTSTGVSSNVISYSGGILTSNVDGKVSTTSLSLASANIYSTNGTLTSNRIVSQSTYSLAFTQGSQPSSSSGNGTTASNPFTINGGAGGSTSYSTGVVLAGNAGSINFNGGSGGDITGTPSLGYAGTGGNINLLAGSGGNNFSGTGAAGNGGNIELQAGTAGLTNTTGGLPGYVAIKGGNAQSGSGNSIGGSIFLVPGYHNGTAADGTIFMNLSPASTIRGNTVFGYTLDNYLQRVQIYGGTFTDKLNVGTSTLDSSAIAIFDSTSKGILLPRMTNVQRNSIATPTTGLLAYSTDINEGLYVNLSTGWQRFLTTADSVGGTSLKWYAENLAAPTTAPTSTGIGSIAIGDGAQALSDNMFVYGNGAGVNATSSYRSNFIGYNAGSGASNADTSNFFGYQAGYGATNSYSSNFFGYQAGYGAYDAAVSNFIGDGAGYGAHGSVTSNFIGVYTGEGAYDTYDSNFIGDGAGGNAHDASYSNFIGVYAGNSANNAIESNFIGDMAGYGASNSSYSNLLGYAAGKSFSGNNIGSNNIIIGTNISLPNTTTNSMNIGGVLFGKGLYSVTSGNPFTQAISGGKIGIGTNNPLFTLDVNGTVRSSSLNTTFIAPTTVGVTKMVISDENGMLSFEDKPISLKWYAENLTAPTTAPTSTGIGSIAIGDGAQALSDNMFVYGNGAGVDAIYANDSNFFGGFAGAFATDANNSNFFGNSAGVNATYANDSNFIGLNAGNGAVNAAYSNFIGSGAGGSGSLYHQPYDSQNAAYSNFIGYNTGAGATNASYANFLGSSAGFKASEATSSNFIGTGAGGFATYANNSNFIGSGAGSSAGYANNSNFLGTEAGVAASGASNSNFVGVFAGKGANFAAYSNLLGYQAGMTFSGNNIGLNNIIIGTNISLPDATTNSMNIGGVLFGTGTYATTTGDPSVTPVSGGKIGIGIVNPLYTLDVNGDAHIGSSSTTDGATILRLEDINSTCDFNANSGSPSCGSDITLKKDITTLSTGDLLMRVATLTPVSYHWKTQGDTDPLNYGFIAQDVGAQFPDLVHEGTWIDGSTRLFLNTGGLMPYVVGAIKEINERIKVLPTLTDSTFISRLQTFLQNIAELGEAIIDKVTTKKLCVEDVCVDRNQFLRMVEQSNTTAAAPTTTTDSSINTDNTSSNSSSGADTTATDPAPATDNASSTDSGATDSTTTPVADPVAPDTSTVQ